MSAINNEEVQEQPINFDAIKIGLASPEKIREWSSDSHVAIEDEQVLLSVKT